jgi:hypothetical protein
MLTIFFGHKTGQMPIKELRQIDFEIFNSHPAKRVEDVSVTIVLPMPDTTVLFAAVANADNRTPDLGERAINTKLVETAASPRDFLATSEIVETHPAIVVKIPYIDSTLSKDRFFIRVTYDGPGMLPVIQGAELRFARLYSTYQRLSFARVLLGVLLISFIFILKGLIQTGRLQQEYLLWTNSYYAIGMFTFVVFGVLVLVMLRYESWFFSWWRPFHEILNPRPSNTNR